MTDEQFEEEAKTRVNCEFLSPKWAIFVKGFKDGARWRERQGVFSKEDMSKAFQAGQLYQSDWTSNIPATGFEHFIKELTEKP